jgi:hypothetical protein
MTYSIELLSGSNAHQWQEFNARSIEGTLYHDLRWKKILEEEFDLKTKYYLIRAVGRSLAYVHLLANPWVFIRA